MKIHIEYCIKWNYGPEFDRVSNIIKATNSSIIVSGNKKPPRSGAFEIILDEKLIYSKFKTGTFPSQSEIKKWIKYYINSS